MDNTNNTYTPASKDQVIVAAMNKGCTEQGANTVFEITREYPNLDLQDVIKEVAGSKGGDKDAITGKLFKDAERNKDKPAKAIKPSNAPQVGTKDYTHRP